MQAHYTRSVEGETITIVGEPPDMKGAMDFVSQAKDVFGNMTCGQCGKQARPVVRRAKGYTFYQMRCECGAQFDFAERKEDGVLFPSRTDKEGNTRGVNGWYHWEKPAESSYVGDVLQDTADTATDSHQVPF